MARNVNGIRMALNRKRLRKKLPDSAWMLNSIPYDNRPSANLGDKIRSRIVGSRNSHVTNTVYNYSVHLYW